MERSSANSIAASGRESEGERDRGRSILGRKRSESVLSSADPGLETRSSQLSRRNRKLGRPSVFVQLPWLPWETLFSEDARRARRGGWMLKCSKFVVPATGVFPAPLMRRIVENSPGFRFLEFIESSISLSTFTFDRLRSTPLLMSQIGLGRGERFDFEYDTL